ncbi:MAG: DsrE family protein [Burkholderiales bacterium]
MFSSGKLFAAFAFLSICFLAPGCATVNAAGTGATAASTQANKVVIQMSDADPKKWALALNNAENVQEDLGKNNVEIEIVAYGPGIAMLKMDSEVSGRVGKAIASGVKIAACENTMTKQKIPRSDIINGAIFVKAGVVELMQKQHEGFAYIRP